MIARFAIAGALLVQAANYARAEPTAAVAQREGAMPSLALTTPTTIEPDSKRPLYALGFAGLTAGFATIGVVMALSVTATERDIDDLLAAQSPGQPAAFTASARTRYNQLVSSGQRYEALTWISLGLAGAAAVSSVALLLWPKPPARGAVYAGHARVVPVITPQGAAVWGQFEF